MHWDWVGSEQDDTVGGKLILYFSSDKIDVDMPSYKAAFDLSQAIDLEIRNALIEEIKSHKDHMVQLRNWYMMIKR